MSFNIDVIEARSFIYDLLSVSFAYPDEALYQSLIDGQYIAELDQRIERIPQTQPYNTIL